MKDSAFADFLVHQIPAIDKYILKNWTPPTAGLMEYYRPLRPNWKTAFLIALCTKKVRAVLLKSLYYRHDSMISRFKAEVPDLTKEWSPGISLPSP